MGGEGFVADGGEGLQAGFYCGNGSVGNNRGQGTGFVSHHEIEQRFIGNGVGAVVVCEFGVGNRFGPRCWVIATEDAEISVNFLVDSFSFTVGLWMISGGEGEVVMEEFSEFTSEGGGELGSTV